MTQPVSYVAIDIQLMDLFSGNALSAPGGNFYVCPAGSALLQPIYDPDNNYALVATNTKTLLNGKIRFAIQQAAGGQAFPPTVDIYGMSAQGRFFVIRGQTVGNVPNYFLDINNRDCSLFIPYSFAAAGANVEYNTNISMPVGSLMKPEVAVQVLVADAGTGTLSYGTLSTQSGGNSAGFMNALVTSTTGIKKATITGATQILGALLTTVSLATTTQVPEWYPIPALDVLLSYKLPAGATGGSGFIIHPYFMPIN